jgi:hypothetical protein
VGNLEIRSSEKNGIKSLTDFILVSHHPVLTGRRPVLDDAPEMANSAA